MFLLLVLLAKVLPGAKCQQNRAQLTIGRNLIKLPGDQLSGGNGVSWDGVENVLRIDCAIILVVGFEGGVSQHSSLKTLLNRHFISPDPVSGEYTTTHFSI
ncbi:hypothetical protein DFS34DRAFT_296199 [Phlyctochytrium arcticum]|nr:hypothetical protein DFS34DRAFT_296199 [Phlyctochytrium arcticum]